MPNNETAVMRRIMLGLAGIATIFRNNVGATRLTDGTFLRYGVGGKGASDLLGWKSIVVGPHHVGQKLAVFVAIEVKDGSGRTTPEQDHFINVVADAGGLAGVARSTEDAMDILAC
jgi:hypothetical protein